AELLELEKVHHLILDAVDIGEAALRQAPVERHLAALVPRLAAAGAVMARTRLRTLMTLARGLAGAGAGAATEPLAVAMRPFGSRQIVNTVHFLLLPLDLGD